MINLSIFKSIVFVAFETGFLLVFAGLVSPTLTKRVVPDNQDEDHYSTFHNIQPRKYSKEEWDDFTQKSTRKALMECTATPEFARWVADNAHRLRVEQQDDASEDELIESSSNSSEETAQEADTGLFRWYWSWRAKRLCRIADAVHAL